MILSEARDNHKNEIKNILFDWGGVITDLHLEATKKAFHDLGLTIFDEHVPHDPLDKVFIPFEIGNISPEEFRNNIRKLSPNPLTDTMIDGAWNAMLGVLPEERWKLLESISQFLPHLFAQQYQCHSSELLFQLPAGNLWHIWL